MLLAVRPSREVPQTRRFRLVETAGLRRFGYPVHLAIRDVPRGKRCLLTQEGRVVPAQFRTIRDRSGAEVVGLDFNASLDPLGTRVHEIQIEDGAESDGKPDRGLRVASIDGRFRVSGTGMSYELPADLSGFLGQVDQDRVPFLRRGSRGLWIGSGGEDANADPAPPLTLRGTIQRQGPLAVGLRYAGDWSADGIRRSVVVDLTFPASKSWIELDWSVAEPTPARPTELGLDLNLAIDGSPTLVDLGATGTIYGALQADERLTLSGAAAGGWEIAKREGPQSSLFARSIRDASRSTPLRAEGWAHVMDATRCTAAAVADFGVRTADRIEVSADGRLRLVRRFDAGADRLRTLRAWFHFVSMPVQAGAVTSPQAMLAPLKVEWLD
jgi:hypothetical protein